jgi:hypothetical protein
MEYLIKRCTWAKIEVMIQLRRAIPCNSHHLKDAYQHWYIEPERSRERLGQNQHWWRSRCSMELAERYLPEHDLFHSAIYLRQSDTSHFFGENAEEVSIVSLD